MRLYLVLGVIPAALVASFVAYGQGEARAAESDCGAVIGTFLTKNVGEGGTYTSRSLLSFIEGGIALFVDSGEGGEKGFAPFTDGRGAWRCVSGKGGRIEIRATTLDFTLAMPAKAQIGRLDFDLSSDDGGKTISGTATLYLVPLEANPFAALDGGSPFKVEGIRVEAQ